MGSLANIQIGSLSVEREGAVSSLIRRNLTSFNEPGSVLAATFRRLKNLHEIYLQEGCQFLVAVDVSQTTKPIACVGLGPFHGLSFNEGVGEIRDLVVDEAYRGQGIGRLLIESSLQAAKDFGYRRLYLETSKNMLVAQKLFESRGFRAVTGKSPFAAQNGTKDESMPSYYLLENLS